MNDWLKVIRESRCGVVLIALVVVFVFINGIVLHYVLRGGRITADRAFAIDDLNYFSFVTLTTLGYGDISPKSPQARCFAVVESVTGVLYLAILISRLAAQFRREDREER